MSSFIGELHKALNVKKQIQEQSDALNRLKKFKKPHVNPLTNELWDPSDPNWAEARASGIAWTIEEIIDAMMPYIGKIAHDIVRNFGGRIEVDDIKQELALWLITNTLGKNEDGTWQDAGTAPYHTWAYRRLADRAYQVAASGRASGSLSHGREERLGQLSLQAPTGEEGSGTVADILAGKSTDPESIMHNRDVFDRLMDVANLSEVEEIVMNLSYGLGETPETIEDPATQEPEQVGIPDPFPGQKKVRGPATQKKGKFGRGIGLEGEVRGTTEVADIINRTEKYYDIFYNDTMEGNRVLSRRSRAQFPQYDLEHVAKDDNDILLTTKQTVNRIRNEAARKIIRAAMEVYPGEFEWERLEELGESALRIVRHLRCYLLEYHVYGPNRTIFG